MDTPALQPDIVPSSTIDRAAIREDAYRLWAWECGQNATRVRDVIEQQTGLSVSEQNVRYWSKHDNWRLRFEAERLEILPQHIRPVVALKLGSAAIRYAQYLEDVSEGKVLASRDMNQAAKITLDAVGFSAIRVQGTEATDTPATAKTERTNYAALSLDELEQREQQLRLPASTDQGQG